MRRIPVLFALGLLVLAPRLAHASRPAHAAPGTICSDDGDGDGDGSGGGDDGSGGGGSSDDE